MIISFLLFLSFSLSGVYFWSSGIPQISHLLFALLSFYYTFSLGKFYSKKYYKYLYFFVFYSLLVNVIYFLQYYNYQFLSSSVQIVFNCIIFVSVTSLIIYRPSTLKVIVYGVVFGYTIQWLVYFLGLGNYALAPRYAGTFNDPNQMAYWLLASFSIFWLTKPIVKSRKFIAFFMTFSFLFFVLLTISRSALLAVVFFLVSFFAYRYTKTFIIGCVSVLIVSISVSSVVLTTNSIIEDEVVLDRLTNINWHKQADERGYTRFFDYPEYVFLGGGQGEHNRFNQLKDPVYLYVEMHTTWGGLLFYYGIPGFASMILFFILILKESSPYNRILLISTFCYAFTTYSFRTPIFWLLLAVIVGTNFFKFNSLDKRVDENTTHYN